MGVVIEAIMVVYADISAAVRCPSRDALTRNRKKLFGWFEQVLILDAKVLRGLVLYKRQICRQVRVRQR